MAIAGRVAIVPKGDWSADATYKRLDAVTYNNTLYFAKKEVPAGTVTSNTEYWSKSIVGSVVTVDDALSSTSTNPVQNKVITNALNGKQNTLVQGSGITIDTTDPTHPQISANIDYTNLINKPTKLSDFTNDKNFITNTANNLSNYYLKTETYTQSEVNDLISQLASLSIDIVETLPTTDISTTTIYLINVPDTTNYVQWMYINNAWANIGSTSVDLTNYYTKTQTDTLLADKVDKVSGKGLSTNDFTNSYKSILDNYTVDSTLDSTSTNPIQNAVVTQALDAKQPKTLSSPITIGGTSQTTVEGALGGLNSLCGTKLTMVTSLPLSPSNQETVLYIGNSSGGLLCGGIYQYQVSEWVMISNVSSFTFNSDEFAVDSTTNEVSLKPSYADIPSFLPNNVSSSNKLATNSSITAITNLIPSDASASNKLATTDSTLKTIQLSGSVDCNTLTEPGLYTASSGAVISITNTPPDIGSAVQLNGGFSVLVTKTNVDGVYYGMQMFIPYGFDVPFIRKSYYLNGQYWTPWQRVCTTSVANVPLTYINTFENETYVKPTNTNVCSYSVTNSICVIKLETVCLSTTDDFVQILSGLPKPKEIMYSNTIDRTMNLNSGARGLFQLVTDGTLRITCSYGDSSVSGVRNFYATFSYPVA